MFLNEQILFIEQKIHITTLLMYFHLNVGFIFNYTLQFNVISKCLL